MLADMMAEMAAQEAQVQEAAELEAMDTMMQAELCENV